MKSTSSTSPGEVEGAVGRIRGVMSIKRLGSAMPPGYIKKRGSEEEDGLLSYNGGKETPKTEGNKVENQTGFSIPTREKREGENEIPQAVRKKRKGNRKITNRCDKRRRAFIGGDGRKDHSISYKSSLEAVGKGKCTACWWEKGKKSWSRGVSKPQEKHHNSFRGNRQTAQAAT